MENAPAQTHIDTDVNTSDDSHPDPQAALNETADRLEEMSASIERRSSDELYLVCLSHANKLLNTTLYSALCFSNLEILPASDQEDKTFTFYQLITEVEEILEFFNNHRKTRLKRAHPLKNPEIKNILHGSEASFTDGLIFKTEKFLEQFKILSALYNGASDAKEDYAMKASHFAAFIIKEYAPICRALISYIEKTVTKNLKARRTEVSAKVRDASTILNGVGAIAVKTKLIALNASVEAAKIGDRGRGFAVIAKEIQELSGQSGDIAAKAQNAMRQIVEIHEETYSEAA